MIWIFWLLGLSFSVAVSVLVIKRNRDLGYACLTAIATAFVLISNILTPRLMNINIFGYGMVIVTGSLIWPFTGQISDMINEVYGRKKTLISFALAYITNLLFVIFVLMANDTAPVWTDQEETFWKDYFTPSIRVFFASSLSYVVCQYLDVMVFSIIKEKCRDRENNARLGKVALLGSVRNVLSDMINMCFDAVVFSVVAFWGIMSFPELKGLIFGSMLLKVIMCVIDTPLFTIFRICIKNVKREK